MFAYHNFIIFYNPRSVQFAEINGRGTWPGRDCDRDPAPAIASLLPSVADLPSGDSALTRYPRHSAAPICDDTTVPSDAITCAAHGAGQLHDISASD